MEAWLQTIVDENNASCASYAPPMNYRAARLYDDSDSATISIVDLMSTFDGRTPPRISGAREAAGREAEVAPVPRPWRSV